ncbi:hypothetical protein Aph01nite_21370 [Acrocarpospora phusangensis]|uniref:Peptidase S9 prolyl oligopeptidase catalytic domain-containing protein n=1 Tax=Acrocarpospora phusangensis TaxID=1070424 RepID=A0A919Q7N4_9ACTN|nr:alpha/beta fold hydrolase [Acrocarpospora phusangensis]GIH23827.1 hypothetical protein Aph01nite_21370 [Acrocarpospora phusangensis]
MRVSFRFSACGRYAACLSAGEDGGLQPEVWDFTRNGVRLLPGTADAGTQVLPLDGDRILLCRNENGRYEITELTEAGERVVAAGTGLVVHLNAGSHTSGVLAVGAAPDGSGGRIFRVGTGLEPLAALPPGVQGAGVPLGPGLLGFTRLGPYTAGPVMVDLVRDAWTQVPGAGPGAQLLAGSPRSGLMLLAEPRPDGYEVRWNHADGRAEPRRVTGIDGVLTPLAAHGDGRRFALRLDRGSRSRLAVLTPETGELTEPAVPDGVLHASAGWQGDTLRVPFTSPGAPGSVLSVTPDGFRLDPPARAVRARVEVVAGTEAVTYGDWRAADRVVIALHGGPQDAWRYAYDRVFAAIAETGVAVVAPNQRGSSGYGAAHRDALVGAWGGPDLDDVLAVAAAVGGRPRLYGVSYGAYLALLAYARRPESWSRCAVVAPFLSPAGLYAHADPSVRRLIDRLDGHSGPDVAPLAERLRPPLMVIHGADDPVIPVAHARRLRTLIPAAIDYLEIPGAGHSPLSEAGGAELTGRLAEFLAA